jgi:hypothetical protein
MKVTRIELHLIRVPFDMGAAPTAFAGMNLTSVDSLFVRWVESSRAMSALEQSALGSWRAL